MKKLLQLITLLYSQMALAQSFTLLPNSVSSNALNTTANRVGINISNPNYELHVNRNGNVNSFAQFTNGLSGNTSSDGFLIGLNDKGEAILKQSGITYPMIFNTGNKDRIRLDSFYDKIDFNGLQFSYNNINEYVLSTYCSKKGSFIRLYADYDNDGDGIPQYMNTLEFGVNGSSETGTVNGLNKAMLTFLSTGFYNERFLIKHQGRVFIGGQSNLAFTFNTQTEKMGLAMGLTDPTRTLDVNGDARIGANGTTISAINNSTVLIDLPSMQNNTSHHKDVTISNINFGKNSVFVSPSIPLPNGFMITYAHVPMNNTVRIGFHNITGNVVDLAEVEFYITVITFP